MMDYERQLRDLRKRVKALESAVRLLAMYAPEHAIKRIQTALAGES